VWAQVHVPTPQELTETRARADAGDPRAEYDLAELYKLGLGVKQDYAEAVKWYIKAAEQGDADSELNLGYAYLTGSGIKQNEKQAAKWLEKAAEQGLVNAQSSIG
jgi:TPR repeat protein